MSENECELSENEKKFIQAIIDNPGHNSISDLAVLIGVSYGTVIDLKNGLEAKRLILSSSNEYYRFTPSLIRIDALGWLPKMPKPKRVIDPHQPTRIIQHNKAVICFFADGSKTVSIPSGGEEFDLEKGVAMCVAKRVLGGYSGVKKAIEGVEIIENKNEIIILDRKEYSDQQHLYDFVRRNPKKFYLTNDGTSTPWCALHRERVRWFKSESEARAWLRERGAK